MNPEVFQSKDNATLITEKLARQYPSGLSLVYINGADFHRLSALNELVNIRSENLRSFDFSDKGIATSVKNLIAGSAQELHFLLAPKYDMCLQYQMAAERAFQDTSLSSENPDYLIEAPTAVFISGTQSPGFPNITTLSKADIISEIRLTCEELKELEWAIKFKAQTTELEYESKYIPPDTLQKKLIKEAVAAEAIQEKMKQKIRKAFIELVSST